MVKTLTLSARLGAHIAALDYDDLMAATVEKTKDCFIDYFASVYAGLDNPLAQTYIDLAFQLGGTGTSPVIGAGRDSCPAYSAFANAAVGHIAETDDGHRTSIMHIGTVVIPVIVALAEQFGADGKRCIESCVVGYDTAIGVGEALGPEHYHTWHTTATAGCFGAAAAAAKMMGLNAEQCGYALGHAGTLAAGLWQFLDDGRVEAKALHPGNGAMNGVMAAYTAAANIPGADRIFEGDRGLFKAMSKLPNTEALLRGITKPLDDKLTSSRIDEVNFKAYPTCGQTHSMIDAMRTIMTENTFDVNDVDRVEVGVYRKTLDIADLKDPKTVQQAKFSVSFCLAMLLSRRRISFTNITKAELRDQEIRQVMDKIVVYHDLDKEPLFPKCRPCSVKVHCGDTVYEAVNYYRLGDPEKPMTRTDMLGKFTDLASARLSESGQTTLINWIENLETMSALIDIRVLR